MRRGDSRCPPLPPPPLLGQRDRKRPPAVVSAVLFSGDHQGGSLVADNQASPDKTLNQTSLMLSPVQVVCRHKTAQFTPRSESPVAHESCKGSSLVQAWQKLDKLVLCTVYQFICFNKGRIVVACDFCAYIHRAEHYLLND